MKDEAIIQRLRREAGTWHYVMSNEDREECRKDLLAVLRWATSELREENKELREQLQRERNYWAKSVELGTAWMRPRYHTKRGRQFRG